MNGANGTETASMREDIDDAIESDELDVDEALEEDPAEFLPFLPPLPFPFPFPGRSRPSVARGRSYFSPQIFSQFVTQPQLQSALTKVRNDVAKNARAI